MSTDNKNNHPGFAIVVYALSLGTAVLYPTRDKADSELLNLIFTGQGVIGGTVTKFYHNPLAVKTYKALFIIDEDYRLKGGDLTRDNLRKVFGDLYDEHITSTGYSVTVKMSKKIIDLFLSWPS